MTVLVRGHQGVWAVADGEGLQQAGVPRVLLPELAGLAPALVEPVER